MLNVAGNWLFVKVKSLSLSGFRGAHTIFAPGWFNAPCKNPTHTLADEEQAILHRFKYDEPLETLRPIVSADQVITLQRMVRQVQWQPEVERYLLSIVRATREHPAVNLGVSPCGTLALYRACEAYAAMQGRDYVQPDDVKRLALLALCVVSYEQGKSCYCTRTRTRCCFSFRSQL